MKHHSSYISKLNGVNCFACIAYHCYICSALASHLLSPCYETVLGEAILISSMFWNLELTYSNIFHLHQHKNSPLPGKAVAPTPAGCSLFDLLRVSATLWSSQVPPVDLDNLPQLTWYRPNPGVFLRGCWLVDCLSMVFCHIL